jgi:hypothetical protein
MANGMLPIGQQQIGGGLKEFFLGSPDRFLQAPTVTGEQQGALSQLLQQALGGIQNPQAGFEPIAQQARTQFEQQTVPSILERLSGLGAQRSSALGQQLGAAGAGLEQNLAAQGAQFGQQNLGQLLQMLQLALRPQFENVYQPGSSGLLGSIGNAVLQGGGQALGTYLGNKPLVSALGALGGKK